jgi:hypothetical protein
MSNLTMNNLKRRGKRRKLPLAIFFLVGFAAIAAPAALRASRNPGAGDTSHAQGAVQSPRAQVLMGGGGPLLPGGGLSSIASVQKQATFPTYLPNVPLAQASSVADVWYRAQTPEEVLIDYSSGVRLYLKPLAFDAASHYQSLQDEGIPGTITTIQGHTAFVVPPLDGQKGSVDVAVNGVELSVIGEQPTITSQDLVTVANSALSA